MALPTLDATFASAADLPRRMMLAQWLVNIQYSGSIADYATLPERYLWAKIAVAAGAQRGEADYIQLPKQYIWKDIYDAVSGTSNGLLQWGEQQAVGHIAAAYRGDIGNAGSLATYIDWPWRYQVASIITNTAIDTDAQAFIATSGATDKDGIDQFVKGVKNLGLWSSMVSWPLRSAQNAGTGTTAYSLGGLGTFNGTLVNGPTWASNGLDFDGNNDRVTLPNGSFGTGNAATSIWAFLKNDTTATRMVVFSQGNNNLSTDGFCLESPFTTDDAANMAFTTSNIAAATTAWKSLFIGNTTAGFRGKNGGTVTQYTLNNALNKTGNACAIGSFGNPAGVAPFDGLISAVIRINATPTTQLNGDIYTLYKNTIGAGLGLP
jgi:hypothetical protein